MSFLSQDKWVEVVRHAPLVSIDLIVQNERAEVLLGWRVNKPAQNSWFVPGGVIRKGETLKDAFTRIVWDELSFQASPSISHESTFFGVYEHHYPDNFAGQQGFGTHYVVLAHRLCLGLDGDHLFWDDALEALPKAQHQRYTWMSQADLLAHPQVHANVKNYFVDSDSIS